MGDSVCNIDEGGTSGFGDFDESKAVARFRRLVSQVDGGHGHKAEVANGLSVAARFDGWL